MATVITSECINCGACEPECPNTAIYQGGVEWDFNGAKHAAISADIFYIVPDKCTECVGFFDHEACAAVCPVDCIYRYTGDAVLKEYAGKLAQALISERWDGPRQQSSGWGLAQSCRLPWPCRHRRGDSRKCPPPGFDLPGLPCGS